MKSYYGQYFDDKFIEEFLIKNNIPLDKGCCLEIGLGEPIMGTNTYLFETYYNWDTICFEPNPYLYQKALDAGRKKVFNCALGKENQDNIPFTIIALHDNNQSAVSSLDVDSRLVESHKDLISQTEIINTQVRTLDTMLLGNLIKEIIFVTIDTEGTELDVLKGFNLNKWKPKLIMVENNFNDTFCEDYLNLFGYKKVYRNEVNDFFILNYLNW
jgi:FkbM family methyltransferase